MKFKLLGVFLLLFSCLAFAQETQTQTTAAVEMDAVAREIESNIRKEKTVDLDHLTVRHENGTVFLEGTALLFRSKYLAEQIASKHKGVSKVNNSIIVKSSEVDDLELQSNIMSIVKKHLPADPFNLVGVKASNGIVTLTGSVRKHRIIDDIFNDVMKLRGVRELNNQIERASMSAADDRMRTLVYRRLYSEFPRYFAGDSPSILILVDHGRVTLVGYANSNVDREKMTSTIRSLPGVISVDNKVEAGN